jgi:RHS repeat-associated protein
LKASASSTSSDDRGYLYDAAWNLSWRTNNGTASQFEVNVKNELTNEPAGLCTYDANGNLLSSGGGRYQYAYDLENRLVQWEDSGIANPVALTDFAYDGLGRLRERLEYVWGTSGGGGDDIGPDTGGGGGSWSLSSETLYIYDGKRVIQERNGSGVPTVSYTRGKDLSGSFEGAGGIGGLLARSSGYSSGAWATNSYYHADGNGNITCLLSSSQSVVASYVYDPFGSTISSSGSMAAANIYRFSSKECHVNSGMYYYLYRFYDPNLQRWINRDPMQEFGGWNLYRFSMNSPINSVDAFGLQETNGGTNPPIIYPLLLPEPTPPTNTLTNPPPNQVCIPDWKTNRQIIRGGFEGSIWFPQLPNLPGQYSPPSSGGGTNGTSSGSGTNGTSSGSGTNGTSSGSGTNGTSSGSGTNHSNGRN